MHSEFPSPDYGANCPPERPHHSYQHINCFLLDHGKPLDLEIIALFS